MTLDGRTPATDATPSATLGAEIRRRRLDAGLTLVRLAEMAQLSQPFLSQVENERAQPSIESLGRIAQALGTTPQSWFSAPAERGVPLAVVRSVDDAGGPSTYRPLVAGDAPFHHAAQRLCGVTHGRRPAQRSSTISATRTLAASGRSGLLARKNFSVSATCRVEKRPLSLYCRG